MSQSFHACAIKSISGEVTGCKVHVLGSSQISMPTEFWKSRSVIASMWLYCNTTSFFKQMLLRGHSSIHITLIEFSRLRTVRCRLLSHSFYLLYWFVGYSTELKCDVYSVYILNTGQKSNVRAQWFIIEWRTLWLFLRQYSIRNGICDQS